MDKMQRLILSNQYQILKLLDKGNSGHYNQMITIISHGYELFYSDLTDQLYDPMPPQACEFVLETLDLYRWIEDHKRANPKDKEVLDHPLAHFHGFDGNNEGAYMGFAQFLMNDQRKFGETKVHSKKTDDFNSHAQMAKTYQRMLDVYKKTGKPHVAGPKERVLAVLNAGMPSR